MSRMEADGRSLIGIDCNFAYSQSIGSQQFGHNYTYMDLWRAVDESSSHLADYFAAGFWEHEIFGAYFWSMGKKPESFDERHQRLTEKLCREKGEGAPESPFKLIGPKQVGKGGLAGMRMLYDLKNKLGKDLCVWPFERHLDEAKVVIAEIYPRLFLTRAGCRVNKIRDLSALNLALAFFKTDAIPPLFAMSDHVTDAIISSAGLRSLSIEGGTIPESILYPSAMSEMIASREGWILGV